MSPLLHLLPLFLGCEASQLSRASLVDRTRILGVASEPAEPAPGDRVSLRSLTVDPDNGIGAVTWFGCVLESADSFGCELDSERIEQLFALDPQTMTPEEQQQWVQDLQEAGFLGVEPELPPALTVPLDLLDGLDEEQLLEGKNYMFTLSALPGDLELAGLDLDAQGQADFEAGLKRMPVSLSPTPNHNPVILEIILDGEHTLHDGDQLSVGAGQSYTFSLSLSEDSVEEYSFRTAEGLDTERVEEPYVSFYASSGSFYQSVSLYPYLEAEWTAPVAPDSIQQMLWFVLRDRRGGMTWFSLELLVE